MWCQKMLYILKAIIQCKHNSDRLFLCFSFQKSDSNIYQNTEKANPLIKVWDNN